MKTSAFQQNPSNPYQNSKQHLHFEQTYQKNKQNTFFTSHKIAFALSFVLHFAFAMTFYTYFYHTDFAQNGDNITTLALATFQTPSQQEEVETPKPKPLVHKTKHQHKEIIKEEGKLAKKEEEVSPTNKAPKAKPNEKIEEGEIIQTLSYKNGSEDDLFSKIKSAIDRRTKYPTMARKRGLEGEVIVEFIIYQNGKVANIRLIKACEYEPFNTAAINAIKKAQDDFPTLSSTTKIELPIKYELDRI
ncbi:energy transducer TonB [Helicobacter sp. MIT 21-1697]|uniref:energy transducer TonB n=1 Tax=Helicobacter sp. MIT 21-1697 TaxID=2993733 RepID=UPI00224B350F|nr:energy transducer TonB [Helicobacter sp. MIT 21-1697]MCX2716474.1 energy transducer TonB [Helicobacter sp. MIT 21-1697]